MNPNKSHRVVAYMFKDSEVVFCSVGTMFMLLLLIPPVTECVKKESFFFSSNNPPVPECVLSVLICGVFGNNQYLCQYIKCKRKTFSPCLHTVYQSSTIIPISKASIIWINQPLISINQLKSKKRKEKSLGPSNFVFRQSLILAKISHSFTTR